MRSLQERIVDQAVQLSQDSDRLVSRLKTIARIGKYVAPQSGYRRQLQKLEYAINNDHASIELIRRIAEDTNPRSLRALANLFLDHTWSGYTKRKEFQKEHGVFPPSFIVISPLAACNLKCVGCYAGAYGHNQPSLSYEDMEGLIEEIRDWGSRFIVLSGGEPTLFWNSISGGDRGIKDLCAQYDDTAFLMYTNGTLIDGTMAEEIAELGNITPAISVEGFRKETDARRGDGVYEEVMGAMGRLHDKGALFGASVTYTTHNVDTVTSDEFADMLIDRGCIYAWYFMYVPVGRKPDLSLMISPQQRRKVAKTTWKWLNTRPLFVADFWNSGPLTKGCIAAGRPNGYMHVTHRGDICPCVFMMYSAHNIHEMDSDTPLMDAIKSDFFKKIRRGQREKQNNPLAPCQIVDHPEVLKYAVESTEAETTQEGQTILTDLHCQVADRAREWSEIADDLWLNTDDYSGLAAEYEQEGWKVPGAKASLVGHRA